MYNDIYSKVSTPMQFAEGLTLKHYNEKKRSSKIQT